jgi:hypothetical protein
VEGNLSPQLDEHVYRAAWLDSERLALARTRTVSTFADIAAAVGAERTRAIVMEAEHAWTHIQSPEFPEPRIEIPGDVLGLYLRDYHGDAIRERFSEDWARAESATANLHQLIVARVVEDRLELGVMLSEDVWPIKAIRPAPDRRFVAFVTLDEETWLDDETRLHVVPIDVSARPALVAEGTGESVDWSPDSRSLLYFQESGWDPNFARYGCLDQRIVVDASGAIEPLKDSFAKCLSYLIFERSDHLFSLPDGRVVFESMSIELPRHSGMMKQLFVMGREPDSHYPMFDRYPITRLIPEEVYEREAGVTSFDLSPDGRRVLYGTGTGDIRLLTLDDGRTELLPLGLHGEYITRDLPRAVWSGPDAFTYVKKIGTRNEFILRRGSSETILSRNWPKEMLWPYPPDSTPWQKPAGGIVFSAARSRSSSLISPSDENRLWKESRWIQPGPVKIFTAHVRH